MSDNERYVSLGVLIGAPSHVQAKTDDRERAARRTVEITRAVQQVVERSAVVRGLCHVFVHHTSASLIVCENADLTVRRDLEHFAADLVAMAIPRSCTTAKAPTIFPEPMVVRLNIA